MKNLVLFSLLAFVLLACETPEQAAPLSGSSSLELEPASTENAKGSGLNKGTGISTGPVVMPAPPATVATPPVFNGKIDELYLGNSNFCLTSGDQLWCRGSNNNSVLSPDNRDPRFFRNPNCRQWGLFVSRADDYACSHLLTNVPLRGVGKNLIANINQTTACAGGDDGIHCWGRYHDYILAGARKMKGPVQSLSFDSDDGCVIQNGEVFCWGGHDSRDLFSSMDDQFVGMLGGYRYLESASQSPVKITELGNDNAEIDVGDSTACVRKKSGTVYCWGAQYHGRVGRGTNRYGAAALTPFGPVLLQKGEPIAGIVKLVRGNYTNCALNSEKNVFCWGGEDALGRGELPYQEPSVGFAVQVPLPIKVTYLASNKARYDTVCASGEGRLFCWGYMAKVGEDGTLDSSSTPVEIKGFSAPVDKIAVGDHAICARTSKPSVECLGSNNSGVLGVSIQSTDYSPIPVESDLSSTL